MSGCLNEVNLIGNLCRDPETRQTQAGKSIVNLTVATSESWKDAAGERKERSEFHRVVIFNDKLGEIAAKYLRKGSKVFLRGSLQTRKWTDQAGVEKYATEIVLQAFNGTLVLLDGKKEGQGGGDTATSAGYAPSPRQDHGFEDEVPFLAGR